MAGQIVFDFKLTLKMGFPDKNNLGSGRRSRTSQKASAARQG
jgi:hypothetical protein